MNPDYYKHYMNPPYNKGVSLNTDDFKALIDSIDMIQKLRKEETTLKSSDFKELGKTFKDMSHIPEDYRRQMALAFIHFFQNKNPNFDECKFMEACGFDNA